MQENISLECALAIALEHARVIGESESLPLLELSGRILAEDVYAKYDNPPFDRSPIDGYACRAEDIACASHEQPVTLEVLGEIDAGGYPDFQVRRGQAARIMTGAPIPEGCDCCVYQEASDYGETRVQLYKSVAAGANYCYRGEDYKKDTLMLEKGRLLRYVELGILAGMGNDRARAYRLPRIALLTTGDEVTPPGQPLLPGKIYNSNLSMLAARMLEFKLQPQRMDAIRDDPSVMADALKNAALSADLIVTTGGVSVGKKDIMHEALELAGAEKLFWHVQMKPGTPTIFSVCGGVPVVSLSGNPFGAAVNFELLIRPMLSKMMQNAGIAPKRAHGEMREPFPKTSKNRRFIRAIYDNGGVSLPHGLHSSGALGSLLDCNCIVDIPPCTEALHAGDCVEVVLL